MFINGVNWNRVEDPLDKEVWERLKANFWVPEKIALSNDIQSWNRLEDWQKNLVKKVFGGLTLLDTLQSEVGAPLMQSFAKSSHEAAVFANITFIEAIHAQSYSAIFSTLCSMKEIDKIFEWVAHDETLQKKAGAIRSMYESALDSDSESYDAASKAASVMLESFLFYSGFYLPLKFSSEATLTNTADIIRLIMRDEGVHGFYIGAKFQDIRSGLSTQQRHWLDKTVEEVSAELREIEELYTKELYYGTPYYEGVMAYLRYNFNKAMMNLGYEPYYDEDSARPETAILAQMAIDANETHDFFSGSGSSYVIGKAVDTDDDDWA